MLLLLPLLGLAGVQASPVQPVYVSANTAICSVDLTATNHGSPTAIYNVQIGRPFIDGAGCEAINNTLTTGVNIGVFQYDCFTSDDGATTNLTFISATGPSTNIQVVESLQKAYPMVPFQKSRICLMTGVDAPDSWSTANAKRDFKDFFDDLKDKAKEALKWLGEKSGFTAPEKGFEKTKRDTWQCNTHDSSCDWNPDNNTCLMTSGCHDGEIPKNNTSLCVYRQGWYDVRVGKPHVNCAGAAYIRQLLRESLPLPELTSITANDLDFQCYEGPDNTTSLAIGVLNVYGPEVNSALERAYPGVEFACPRCKNIIDWNGNGETCRNSEAGAVPASSKVAARSNGFLIGDIDVDQETVNDNLTTSKVQARTPDHDGSQLLKNTADCSVHYLRSIGNVDTEQGRAWVRVGRPFVNGAGCKPIERTLNRMLPSGVTNFQCNDDGFGDTQLRFDMLFREYSLLDKTLGTAYPDVGFETYRYCGVAQ